MCFVIICFPVCGVINFKIQPSLSDQAVFPSLFPTWPNNSKQNLNISDRELFRRNKTHFCLRPDGAPLSRARMSREDNTCSGHTKETLIQYISCTQICSFRLFSPVRHATLLKKDSETVVFLWIWQNFKEHLFLQNTSGGCFCFC